MLILADRDGIEHFVDPAAIVTVVRHAQTPFTTVKLRDVERHISTLTTPMDIARMRAAWEMRFHADKVIEQKALPIAIRHDAEHGYMFVCCEATARRTAEVLAEQTSHEKRNTAGAELLRAFEAHVAGKAPCPVCFGGGKSRAGGVPAPVAVNCSTCGGEGWIDR